MNSICGKFQSTDLELEQDPPENLTRYLIKRKEQGIKDCEQMRLSVLKLGNWWPGFVTTHPAQ